jgi:glyoxylase-like metal-dependent hydrolase (beta-lactamase superfamily II)
MKWKLFLVLAVFAVSANAQTNLTHDSYAKAREVLDRAVNGYGGLAKLRGIENFHLVVVGDTVHRNQSHKPFTSDRTPYRTDVKVDLKNSRVLTKTEGGYPGGFSYHNGILIDKTDAVSFDHTRKTSVARPNIPAAALRSRYRWIPQYWVLNAVERSSRLRYLGKTQFDGRPHHAVSYPNEDGAENTLYFDERTGLLSKFEGMITDVYFGDSVAEVIFPGYREENGLKVPTGRLTKTNGELTEELRFEKLTFNNAFPADAFKAPDGYTAVTFPAPEPATKYADNIYTVNAGGYNVLAVGFKDHVFVMESPGGDNASNQAIDQIRKLFPGKPIKYLAVTHHHDDHSGGIRRYIGEGVTLLALPGEKAFFEKVAQSKFTIDPDFLTLNPKPLTIDTIKEGRRVLTDGTSTVELIDIGPGGHTDEMLVAYLPAQKLIFQGDLLNRPPNGDPATINDTTVHFANWLENSKLAVDRVIGVHGPPSTLEELRKGVAEHRSTSAKN